VHGMLHLLGFDHERDADAEAMEALETKVLSTIGIADPFAEDVRAGRAEVSP
jgi:probable rRNA maturation factor